MNMRVRYQLTKWQAFAIGGDQLTVGLIAQLAEQRTDIMGSNPVKAWIFSSLNYSVKLCV